MKRLILIAALLSAPSLAFAQQAVVGQKYAWDFSTTEAATVVRFEIKIDAGAFVDAGKVVSNDALTPTGKTSYAFVIPALTPGTHTFETRACLATVCGASAAPFSHAIVVISTPTGQRIQGP